MAWQLRPAQAEELTAIKALLASVGGDQENLQPSQFVVAQGDDGIILGCGRLKPYLDFVELASIAVVKGSRSAGIGRGIVNQLLEQYQGPIYLICEDDVVDFFRRFGFELIPVSEMPLGLLPKWQHYAAQPGHLNVMRRA
jgi:N-acetylglutamate synthase-like GNAT family acetyltransferase